MATWPKNTDGTFMTRADAQTFSSVNGGPGIPGPVRSLIAQSGSRKVLITWELPTVHDDIKGYKIYTGTENSLLDTIRDGSVRQYSIAATSGSTPPTMNIFVSCYNSAGIESKKLQVQGTATAEAGAPADPTPPAGTAASGDTGVTGDSSTGFTGFTGDDRGFTR